MFRTMLTFAVLFVRFLDKKQTYVLIGLIVILVVIVVLFIAL